MLKENLKSISLTIMEDAAGTRLGKLLMRRAPKKIKKELRKMTDSESKTITESLKDKATLTFNQSKSMVKLVGDSGARIAGAAVTNITDAASTSKDKIKLAALKSTVVAVSAVNSVKDSGLNAASKVMAVTNVVGSAVEDKAIEGAAVTIETAGKVANAIKNSTATTTSKVLGLLSRTKDRLTKKSDKSDKSDTSDKSDKSDKTDD